jgi:hypothetical protein
MKSYSKKEEREAVKKGISLFKNHLERLSEDVRKFNENREKVDDTIKRGTRRTSGRII